MESATTASDAPDGTSASSEPSASFSSGPDYYTFYDVFFWRDTPDWYRKTFQATGMGLAVCALKQYLNRNELEVFLPPRSKVLPTTLRSGYRNSQMLKYAFLSVGREVTVIAGVAATFYGGAYYLGKYRGQHNWENFAASGAAAGMGAGMWLLRPIRTRPIMAVGALGALMGATMAWTVAALGQPYWEEGHDFEGYFFGSKVNLKATTDKEGSER